jgi:hypothetical protein
MPLGHIRTGLVTAFAVIFGIVQIICACMPSAQNSDFVDAPTQTVHQMSHMGAGDMAAHAGHDMSAQSSSKHDHGEHDHQADCSHCDDTVVLAVNVDVAPAVFTTPTVYKTVSVATVITTRAGMAGTNLAGLRWLDPPRPLTNPTPISLNTRSLT